jgi:hypothetical protein
VRELTTETTVQIVAAIRVNLGNRRGWSKSDGFRRGLDLDRTNGSDYRTSTCPPAGTVDGGWTLWARLLGRPTHARDKHGEANLGMECSSDSIVIGGLLLLV